MGDENKIEKKDLIQITKDKFLPREIEDKDGHGFEYNIGQELKNSRRYVDYKYYLTILIFLAAIAGLSYVITQYVQNEYKKPELGFGDDDLNLKEMLTSTQNEKKNLNIAQQKFDDLVKEQEQTTLDIKTKFQKQKEDVLTQNLPSEKSQPLIASLKIQEEKEIQTVKNKYAPLIQSAHKDVEKSEVALANKQKKLEEQTNKAESMVNNYKRLQKIREDNLKNDYEKQKANLVLKYNPVFSNDQLKKIINEKRKKTDLTEPQLFDYNARLLDSKDLTESQFEEIRKNVNNYKVLITEMQKIPYINSVGPSVDILQQSTDYLISEYERLINQLSYKIINQSNMIDKYNNAFAFITETSPDSGFIIDGRNPSNIAISMKSVLNIKPGMIAYIFRKDDEYIATIEIKAFHNIFFGNAIEIATGKTIQPFDKIFLKRVVKIEPPANQESSTEETGTNNQNQNDKDIK